MEGGVAFKKTEAGGGPNTPTHSHNTTHQMKWPPKKGDASASASEFVFVFVQSPKQRKGGG